MSWKEDDRNRRKRNNARTFKKQHYRNISENSKESSSSPHLRVDSQHIRGLIDVADSSDDRFSFASNQPPQTWSTLNSDDEDLNEQMQGGDFELLQKLPTVTSYTTLSSEKHWETETEKTFEKTSYFTLNLTLINAGLQTIPFYKRMDYPSSLFDNFDIKRMNLEAEIAENKYPAVVNDFEEGLLIKPSSGLSRKSNSAKSVKTVKSIENEKKSNEIKIENDNELDELLKLTESDVSKLNIKEDEAQTQTKNVTIDENQKNNLQTNEVKGDNNTTEEIQQWLDQVLE